MAAATDGSAGGEFTQAPPVPRTSSQKRPVVCVFCGASPGTSPLHMEAARALARLFHERGISLVYGGGTVGIMGEVAKTLVELSGPEAVHGVIPKALVRFERDWGQDKKIKETIDEKRFGRTTVVPDMHTRKQMMAQEVINGGDGSGFVALSGGYGTMEELMEITTWNQLGIHARGVVVYNVDGYYDGLLQWVKKAVDSGFIADSNKNIMREATTPEQVVDALQNYQNSEGRFKLQWGEK
ncbi:LOG family protein isoform A [Sphaceloma murrayae]|uniref:LOG family protein isoform A n=1 Tax=Sphaceloma murrayae TaxID=2082308 RepID=A0A2K1QHA8_9PEZI|nr:LOG family protein isoform A [Sphaceloma murrayae]